jgi:predicted DCC family thiol-disulfide oxidoreductase YuxK
MERRNPNCRDYRQGRRVGGAAHAWISNIIMHIILTGTAQTTRYFVCFVCMDHPIVIFDGVCALCNASVRLVIKNDSKSRFRFSTAQSRHAQELLKTFDTYKPGNDTLLLIENNRLYAASTAALRIARKMDGLWPVFYFFMVIPRPVRDFVYKLIAKNRYRLFGKYDHCMIPDKHTEYRFIE